MLNCSHKAGKPRPVLFRKIHVVQLNERIDKPNEHVEKRRKKSTSSGFRSSSREENAVVDHKVGE
jgi:hypothetical protein